MAKNAMITLLYMVLYTAKDNARNNAVALQEFMKRK